ncbi:MAG: response regulator [Cyanobacteria bacterium P01_A01_bin.114]
MSATKVMVVEDESIISLDIKNSLVKLGYNVSGVAASGDIALRKIQDNCPDLILMDIHLKGEMTGIEVSEKIKADFQIPVIYLTANADSQTFQKAKQTDPYSYILKPFAEKELGLAIELALHQHQKQQAIKSSERWYATAFQALKEAIIATDANGYVVFMNAFAEMMTGWTLADALDRPVADILKLQKKIQQLDVPGLSESTDSILAALFEGRQFVSLPDDICLLTKPQTAIPLEGNLSTPGTLIPIEGNSTSIKDFSGTVVGSIFIFRRVQSTSSSIAQPSSYEQRQRNAEHRQCNAEHRQRNPLAHQANKSQAAERAAAQKADDIALIKAFTQAFIKGKSVLLSTANLFAEASASSVTLTAKAEGIIINVKHIDGKLTAVVKQDSPYWEVVRYVLIENSFFPVSQRTNGTAYYQYRSIPGQCQIYHTSGVELWEAWHGKTSLNQKRCRDRTQANLSRSNIIVLRRGSWYHIQTMRLNQDHLLIKTIGGEIFVQLEDSLIWGTQT